MTSEMIFPSAKRVLKSSAKSQMLRVITGCQTAALHSFAPNGFSCNLTSPEFQPCFVNKFRPKGGRGGGLF